MVFGQATSFQSLYLNKDLNVTNQSTFKGLVTIQGGDDAPQITFNDTIDGDATKQTLFNIQTKKDGGGDFVSRLKVTPEGDLVAPIVKLGQCEVTGALTTTSNTVNIIQGDTTFSDGSLEFQSHTTLKGGLDVSGGDLRVLDCDLVLTNGGGIRVEGAMDMTVASTSPSNLTANTFGAGVATIKMQTYANGNVSATTFLKPYYGKIAPHTISRNDGVVFHKRSGLKLSSANGDFAPNNASVLDAGSASYYRAELEDAKFEYLVQWVNNGTTTWRRISNTNQSSLPVQNSNFEVAAESAPMANVGVAAGGFHNLWNPTSNTMSINSSGGEYHVAATVFHNSPGQLYYKSDPDNQSNSTYVVWDPALTAVGGWVLYEDVPVDMKSTGIARWLSNAAVRAAGLSSDRGYLLNVDDVVAKIDNNVKIVDFQRQLVDTAGNTHYWRKGTTTMTLKAGKGFYIVTTYSTTGAPIHTVTKDTSHVHQYFYDASTNLYVLRRDDQEHKYWSVTQLDGAIHENDTLGVGSNSSANTGFMAHGGWGIDTSHVELRDIEYKGPYHTDGAIYNNALNNDKPKNIGSATSAWDGKDVGYITITDNTGGLTSLSKTDIHGSLTVEKATTLQGDLVVDGQATFTGMVTDSLTGPKAYTLSKDAVDINVALTVATDKLIVNDSGVHIKGDLEINDGYLTVSTLTKKLKTSDSILSIQGVIAAVGDVTTGIAGHATLTVPTAVEGVENSIAVTDSKVELGEVVRLSSNVKLHNGPTHGDFISVDEDGIHLSSTGAGLKIDGTKSFLQVGADFVRTSDDGLNVKTASASIGKDGNKVMVDTNGVSITGPTTIAGVTTIDGDLTISTGRIVCNDLQVQGKMTTVNSKDVAFADNHVHLNAFNSLESVKSSGIVSTCKRVGTEHTGIKLVFTTGSVVTIKDASDEILGDNIFEAGAILSIHATSGASNEVAGLYEYLGAGLLATTTTFEFTRSASAITSNVLDLTVYQVEVSHLYFDEKHSTENSHLHGDVTFGHFTNTSEKGTGYVNLLMGDIEHTSEEVQGTATHEITKHLTILQNSSSKITEAGKLSATAPNGSVYKIVNNGTETRTVTDGVTNKKYTINPNSISTFVKAGNTYFQ